MEPSFKRQRISAPRGEQRHSSGYDGHSRFYGPAILRPPLNSSNGAVHGENNDPTDFYGAVNAREESANCDDFQLDDEYESGEESYEEEAPEVDLAVTRQKLDNKLKSTFEAIFEKYGKDFSGVGDEIDLRTGEIIVDNGHVAEMHTETDAGEGRGRGMLRAFTEEPEQARFPQQDVEDSDDVEDAGEAQDDMDTDYHVRGRQMLRAFTQEPDLGRETGKERDEYEYDGDTSKLNTIVEDDSDDDDILYQSSGIIPVKSMAPPPRPPLFNHNQHKSLPKLQASKPAQTQRPSNRSAAYPSEPDILAQFGQELGPRIAEYVSRQKSVDEGSIDPKWRTPALPAATAGNRPILKSMILQPNTERSPSPNGNSLWAPEKKRRRRRRRANNLDMAPSGKSETAVQDGTDIPRERITRSRVSTRAASAQIGAPQNPEQGLVSETADQDSYDSDPFGDNEPRNSESLEEAAPRQRSPAGRNRYTDAEDKQLVRWAKWIYHGTEYKIWSPQHWELLSKENPRHTGPSFCQRYRKLYAQNGGQHPFLGGAMGDQDASKDSTLEPGPPSDHGVAVTAEGSSVAGTPEAALDLPRVAASRFKPFKDILHKLYVVEEYPLRKVCSIMDLQYDFRESHAQYKKYFREVGFSKRGKWWDEPEYAGLSYEQAVNLRRNKKRAKKIKQAKMMAEMGLILPTPDPEEVERVGRVEQVETKDEGREARRMKRQKKKDGLPGTDHDENQDGMDQERGNDDSSHLEHGDSYDLSKLAPGASNYISPNSEIAMEEDQMVELPKNKSEHIQELETNHTGRILRSRVIPNSQSSQDMTSPTTSQAMPHQAVAPMTGSRRDALDPSYMFSDEEDEAAPVAPQTHATSPQESPEPQHLGDSASLITPPAQESDIPQQISLTTPLSTEQPKAITASMHIKDEPQAMGRGLGDIYALPRSPPRLPRTPAPVTPTGSFRVVITRAASSSPLTSPAARTPTPPPTLAITSVTKSTPKQSPVPESTPRRSQPPLLRLSSTPTPRRERSTSRPRLTSRSGARSVRSRASMTPISQLRIRSPLRHNTNVGDEDESGDIIPLSSRRSRAIGSGMSGLSPYKGPAADVSALETPSRRGRVAGANGEGEDGDLIQTPGGAWRRCGESSYKCGRGFCFRCSAGGE
ncbi:hypothetical protein V497_07669 [Pseudogymnoascus sp. VKM F-4516 (FW-969)]|nr:hypothetical protein V497_07669 [Pseudogymnoascus sp. VKM F-4516 (FW-969)]